VGLRVKIARYSVYLLYWYKSKRTDAGYSVYLLYWYKSTKTDAQGAAGIARCGCEMRQLVCFTSTKVLALLVLKYLRDEAGVGSCVRGLGQ
jgi:hypothetical protein